MFVLLIKHFKSHLLHSFEILTRFYSSKLQWTTFLDRTVITQTQSNYAIWVLCNSKVDEAVI